MPSRVPMFDHVVVVVEENHALQQIIGSPDAPYINSLALDPHGALFTQSFAVSHPSQPNYLTLFSGSNQGVTDDFTPTTVFSTPNLAASLLRKHLRFTGFAEDLPFVGFTGTSSANYVRRHTPWVNWQGGAAPGGLPVTVNQPFAAFPTNFRRLPTVSFITPNLQDDMHDGTVVAGDAWLQRNLGPYVQWAKRHNSLLILTFDEDDLQHGDQITTVFVGAGVRHGAFAEPISDLNVLRTIEAMYHLPPSGNEAAAAPITNVWARSPA